MAIVGRVAVCAAVLCAGAEGFAPAAPLALRGSSACASAQRRAAPATTMNANNLEKIVVCTGPTCTRTGGGKKLKKMFDEMAAPLGVRTSARRSSDRVCVCARARARARPSSPAR